MRLRIQFYIHFKCLSLNDMEFLTLDKDVFEDKNTSAFYIVTGYGDDTQLFKKRESLASENTKDCLKLLTSRLSYKTAKNLCNLNLFGCICPKHNYWEDYSILHLCNSCKRDYNDSHFVSEEDMKKYIHPILQPHNYTDVYALATWYGLYMNCNIPNEDMLTIHEPDRYVINFTRTYSYVWSYPLILKTMILRRVTIKRILELMKIDIHGMIKDVLLNIASFYILYEHHKNEI